jgi:hypothetical protein
MTVSWLPPALKAASVDVIQPDPEQASAEDAALAASPRVGWVPAEAQSGAESSPPPAPWRPKHGRRTGPGRSAVIKATRSQGARPTTLPGQRIRRSFKAPSLHVLAFFGMVIAGVLVFLFGMHQGQKMAPVPVPPTVADGVPPAAPVSAQVTVDEPAAETEAAAQSQASVVDERSTEAAVQESAGTVDQRAVTERTSSKPDAAVAPPAESAAAPPDPGADEFQPVEEPEPSHGDEQARLVETRSLTLTSVPAGAEVLVDGEVLGVTPYVLVRGVGRDVSYSVRHPGYAVTALAWGANKDRKKRVTLAPL